MHFLFIIISHVKIKRPLYEHRAPNEFKYGLYIAGANLIIYIYICRISIYLSLIRQNHGWNHEVFPLPFYTFTQYTYFCPTRTNIIHLNKMYEPILRCLGWNLLHICSPYSKVILADGKLGKWFHQSIETRILKKWLLRISSFLYSKNHRALLIQ